MIDKKQTQIFSTMMNKFQKEEIIVCVISIKEMLILSFILRIQAAKITSWNGNPSVRITVKLLLKSYSSSIDYLLENSFIRDIYSIFCSLFKRNSLVDYLIDYYIIQLYSTKLKLVNRTIK
ncbi:hypothetical protein BpHYR1_039551 [Brachionus plicatilis]|uniref:Uncharacterized protein n=1 Tax=Brachionus plicatilis TaxID=10195 RepID=A0A3M7QVK8_BRAPC|nr:hypothetical protein BpHYR1_039551 [Brachionus plicatilis]